MGKYIVGFVLVILLLSAGQGYCEEISKCSSELEYLYNYYYDSTALKLSPQKAITIDSSATISSDKITEKNFDSIDDSLLIDSTVSEADKPENSNSKEQAEENPKDITRYSYDLPEFDPFNCVAMRFEGDILYISVMINYTGDGSDLDALGVIHGPIYGEIITVSFPLSILPQVTALQTVIRICDSGKAEYNSIESK